MVVAYATGMHTHCQYELEIVYTSSSLIGEIITEDVFVERLDRGSIVVQIEPGHSTAND